MLVAQRPGIVINCLMICPVSDVVDGVCLSCAFFPSDALEKLSSIGTFVVFSVIPLAVVMFSYVSIYVIVKRQGLFHQSFGHQYDDKSRRSELKLIKLAMTVCACCLFCWYPVGLYYLISTFYTVNLLDAVWYLMTCIGFINCCADPFIYAFKHDDIRRSCRSLLCCLKNKPEEQTSNATESSQAISATTGNTAAA